MGDLIQKMHKNLQLQQTNVRVGKTAQTSFLHVFKTVLRERNALAAQESSSRSAAIVALVPLHCVIFLLARYRGGPKRERTLPTTKVNTFVATENDECRLGAAAAQQPQHAASPPPIFQHFNIKFKAHIYLVFLIFVPS